MLACAESGCGGEMDVAGRRRAEEKRKCSLEFEFAAEKADDHLRWLAANWNPCSPRYKLSTTEYGKI